MEFWYCQKEYEKKKFMEQSSVFHAMKDIEFTTYLRVFCIFFLAIIVGLPTILFAQDDGMNEPDGHVLQAGIASKDITPDTQVNNWVTGEPYGQIRDSIYTRALVLSRGDQKVVVIQWDLVDAGESATARVRTGVSRALNIPEQNIIVHASHNHSAPWAPIYDEQHRGKERDTWWAVRYMPPQHEEPHFKAWMRRLIDQTVAAATAADRAREPATVWVGRADVSEFLRNRRPRAVKEGIEESHLPGNYNYRHEDWDPNILSGSMTFGPLDRAMTLVSFRGEAGSSIANLFHLSCHAVSIYPYMDAISGDWPGETVRRINKGWEGQSMFLQGTAGDVNPWQRGAEAVEEMAEGLTGYARKAYRYSARLQAGKLATNRTHVGLPLTDYGKQRTGLKTLPAEIQVVTYGPLAIVTLPGEPMTELGIAIKKRSPFPQTLVLGYANGNGVHYVGMPGEKAYGGYEVGKKTSIGTDRAGLIMVEAAEDLLHEMYTEREDEEKNKGDQK